jgi:hypothetical protein
MPEISKCPVCKNYYDRSEAIRWASINNREVERIMYFPCRCTVLMYKTGEKVPHSELVKLERNFA